MEIEIIPAGSIVERQSIYVLIDRGEVGHLGPLGDLWIIGLWDGELLCEPFIMEEGIYQEDFLTYCDTNDEEARVLMNEDFGREVW